MEGTKKKTKVKAQRVFISQPMRGRTNEEILAEREAIIEYAKKRYGDNLEIIDSFFEDAPVDAKPLWYLGKSLQLLSTADIAIFAMGWDKARGCRIENRCAIEYGIATVKAFKD